MLLSRWQHLMKLMELPENLATYHALIKAYSEKHRKYHNVSHLDSVFTWLDSVDHLTVNKGPIELALWFHDAIYKPFSSSNESDSADWARKFLDENNISQQTQELVYQLVMATSHSSIPKSDDEKLIVDIDLSILGQPEDRYEAFSTAVRSEYRLVPSSIYARNRRSVLVASLNRERIYSSEFFYKTLEKQASKNLQSELNRL